MSAQTIVAMMLPPNAGRVCRSSFVSGSKSSCVQSAVRPQCRIDATVGASERPIVVAPTSTISGAFSRTSETNASLHQSFW